VVRRRLQLSYPENEYMPIPELGCSAAEKAIWMQLTELEAGSSSEGVGFQFARLIFMSSLGSQISLQRVKLAGSCAVRIWFGWWPALVEETIMAAGWARAVKSKVWVNKETFASPGLQVFFLKGLRRAH
jgi:hypothetical protein